jgi:hypothetical protein
MKNELAREIGEDPAEDWSVVIARITMLLLSFGCVLSSERARISECVPGMLQYRLCVVTCHGYLSLGYLIVQLNTEGGRRKCEVLQRGARRRRRTSTWTTNSQAELVSNFQQRQTKGSSDVLVSQ